MEKGQYHLTVPGASSLSISTATTTLPRPSLPRGVGAAASYALAEKHDVDIFSRSLYEINKRLAELGDITEASTFAKAKSLRFDSALTNTQKMERELQFRDTHAPPQPPDRQEHRLRVSQEMAAEMYLSGASLEDIRKALKPKALIDPATRVPHHYHEFLKVFDQSEATNFPLTETVTGASSS
jgi:hypothetical protein